MDLEAQQGINGNVQWFQQDGATPHTANITLTNDFLIVDTLAGGMIQNGAIFA